MHARARAASHTAVFYLPGSHHRWSYSVNFNTGILDILHGCGLLCSSPCCCGWASLYFPASRSLSQKERDVNRRLLSTVGTVTLYLASAPACAPRLYFPAPSVYFCCFRRQGQPVHRCNKEKSAKLKSPADVSHSPSSWLNFDGKSGVN